MLPTNANDKKILPHNLNLREFVKTDVILTFRRVEGGSELHSMATIRRDPDEPDDPGDPEVSSRSLPNQVFYSTW